MTTVAIGMNLKSGPYGGGNQFGHALVAALRQQGINVVSALDQPDIDLIIVTEVRPWLDICAFSMNEATQYRARHGTPVVLRVNECDERKENTLKLLNEALRAAAHLADHSVYISSWLRDVITENERDLVESSSVIHNGADAHVFNSRGYRLWDGIAPLKIVTHHWSSNRLKGWDIYKQLDSLADSKLKGKIEFTYIGNVPDQPVLAHSHVIAPLIGTALANELQQHHVYITASRNEPAGMHHIEGALSGLPLLYRQSGALPEYCNGFGVSFNDKDDFPTALEKIMSHYHEIQSRLTAYPYTAAKMTNDYLRLFTSRIGQKRRPAARGLRGELDLKLKLAALRVTDHARHTIASR